MVSHRPGVVNQRGGRGAGNPRKICYNKATQANYGKETRHAVCKLYSWARPACKFPAWGSAASPSQRIDQPGTRALLKAAHEAGINYIDTARAYTVSEAWIGQSLQELGLRDEFVLATKCRALTRAEMEAQLAQSLADLRTDHIELYQFHNPSLDDLKTILAPGGALEALLAAKGTRRRGAYRHHGAPAAVFGAALDVPQIETVMFPYNIVEQQGAELIARCHAAGKGFIAMKPLAGGAIEDGRLALRYVLSDPNVTVAIPAWPRWRSWNATWRARPTPPR